MEKTNKQKIKELIDKLYLSLTKHSEEWESTEYVLRHKETNLELWICTGRLSFQIYRPYKVELPIFKAWKLYNEAYEFWKNNSSDYENERLFEAYKIIKKLK